MSKKFLHIGLGGSFSGLAADPTDPMDGDFYYNTGSNLFRQRLNGSWSNVGTVSSVAMSVPAFLQVAGSPITGSGTLAVTYSGTALPIANGGTNGTSQAAGFNNLSPVTSAGDLIIGNGVNSNTRLAIGSNGDILTVTAGAPVWAPPAYTGTVTSVGLSMPSAFSVANSPVTGSNTLTVTYSGTAIPITSGGTGQTSASAAFNGLSPANTTGDLIYSSSGTTNSRLAIGSTGAKLTVVGGVPAWQNDDYYGCYVDSSAGTVDGTTATYTYGTVVTDPNNSYSGGVFTAPVAGFYHLSAQIGVATTIGSAQAVYIEFYRNSSTVIKSDIIFGNGVNAQFMAKIDIDYPLAASDTIQVRVQCSVSTTAIAAAAANHFSWAKVGK